MGTALLIVGGAIAYMLVAIGVGAAAYRSDYNSESPPDEPFGYYLAGLIWPLIGAAVIVIFGPALLIEYLGTPRRVRLAKKEARANERIKAQAKAERERVRQVEKEAGIKPLPY